MICKRCRKEYDDQEPRSEVVDQYKGYCVMCAEFLIKQHTKWSRLFQKQKF